MNKLLFRMVWMCTVVVVSLSCAGRNVHMAPAPDVNMDPQVLAKFAEEIREYVALRRSVAGDVGPVPADATPEQMAAYQQTFKKAIQKARHGAKQGDMFKKRVEAAIRRIIQKEMNAPQGPAIRKETEQGNPNVEGVPQPQNPQTDVKKTVTLRVNADYPDSAPVSTMPPSLLLKLPQLPEEVRYRFVGRHLILRDTEANVILDYILNAMPATPAGQ